MADWPLVDERVAHSHGRFNDLHRTRLEILDVIGSETLRLSEIQEHMPRWPSLKPAHAKAEERIPISTLRQHMTQLEKRGWVEEVRQGNAVRWKRTAATTPPADRDDLERWLDA